jgi:serine protease
MKRHRTLSVFCLFFTLLLFVSLNVGALDTATRVVGPVKTWEKADLEGYDPQWLQVKFVEGSDVRLEGGRLVDDSGLDLAKVEAVISAAEQPEIRRTFRHDRATLRAWKVRGEARSGVVGPDLSLWFNIRAGGGRTAVARLVNALNLCAEVEIAHPVPMPEPAVVISSPDSPGGTPDFTGQQDYLYDTPVGLDAPAAWAVPGGRGEGMRFIDVEWGWIEDHEDFELANLFYEGGASGEQWIDHGTAVLGEVIGQPNGYGITGFASETLYGTVSVVGTGFDASEFYEEAMSQLDPGEIWLIEMQGESNLPMEYYQANYDVIWTSTFSLGVVCVEAGGNGSNNLDSSSFNGIFDRDVRDSGAIMVAAGTPYDRVAESFTNYGSRMDVHAWGSQIVTTGYGDLYNGGSPQTEYTAGFGGTSGASPMVVGAALCLQGVALANLDGTFSPLALRALLHDTGVPHLDPTREIGPRPDLGAAVEQVLGMGALKVVVAPGPAYDNPPLIRVFPPEQDAAHVYEYSVYGSPHYGLNVTCGDMDGDGIDEILTGAGPGEIYGPHVRGFEMDGTPLAGLSFLAYGTNKWGVNVAAGDLDNDGYDEIITGAGPGEVFGPHVRGWNYDGFGSVAAMADVSFFAYGTPKWGVNVTTGDIDGDGYSEIVTGAGPGAIYGPHVRGWDYDSTDIAPISVASFLAYGTNKYGVNVSCGDVDGDGIDEIITAPGPGAMFGAHVRGFEMNGSPLTGLSFFAWPPTEVRYGAKVFAGADLDGDGWNEMVVGSADPGADTVVKVFQYDGTEVTQWFWLEAFSGLTGGTTVAAGRF